MLFSALLPTRNGGPFLENCIASILNQDFDSFELVISDNANMDATPQILARYRDDPRVKITRLEESVSVTDNWNQALRGATGEYVIMMGDDDLLLPGYFRRMAELIKRYGQPDCILYNGYSFIAPGSSAGNATSYFKERHFSFGPDLQAEGVMSVEQRQSIVRDMFRFRVRIPLNMQTTLVRRHKLPRFYPPFPDHYALNSLLLSADKWIFSPERFLVVGVSPKSFGHYFYSSKHKGGLAYLGIDPNFPGMLPGSDLENGMHMWLNRLIENFGEAQLEAVKVDRAAYVRRQVFFWYMQKRLGVLSSAEFVAHLKLLSPADWMRLSATLVDKPSWQRLLRLFGRSEANAAEEQWAGLTLLPNVADIGQFSRWVSRRDRA
jgi:glycosyltransferase involved in cell wall biosynthesis